MNSDQMRIMEICLFPQMNIAGKHLAKLKILCSESRSIMRVPLAEGI